MSEAERIKGKKREALLRQLKTNKTLVNLRLLGQDYSRLTVVTGIRTQNKISYFSIDCPRGFEKAIGNVDVWKMHFEFSGEDGVLYLFRAVGEEVSNREVWVRFPEFIEREQRRKHFRIKLSPGATIHFTKDSTQLKMGIIDISLGGILVMIAKGIEKAPVLNPGDELKDIELVFPTGEETPILHINKALVVRSEKDSSTGRYRYGLQFINIERMEEKALTAAFYQLQRQLLMKRSRVYD